MNRRRGGSYRFSVAPLESAVQARFPGQSASRVLHVSGSTWGQMRYEGVTAFTADKLAHRLGLHPAEIWADWVLGNADLEDAR